MVYNSSFCQGHALLRVFGRGNYLSWGTANVLGSFIFFYYSFFAKQIFQDKVKNNTKDDIQIFVSLLKMKEQKKNKTKQNKKKW